MSILAIDFGVKRLGLAISQGFLAEPLGEIPNSKQVFDNLREICAKYEVEKIIIGLPEGKLVNRVLDFGKNCQKKIGVGIEFKDEVFTSRQATQFLIEAGTSAKKRKKMINAAAAAVILQQYLLNQKIK